MIDKRKPQKTDEELLAEIEELKKLRDEGEGTQKTKEEVEIEAVLADDETSEEDKVWAKRYGDTRSHLAKKENEWATKEQAYLDRISELEANPPSSSDIPTNIEELDSWKETNPDLFKAIKAIASQIASKEIENASAPLREKVEDLTKKEKEAHLKLVKKQVMEVHPELEEFNKSGEFHNWVAEQPSWIEKALYEGMDAQQAIQALTLYKVENDLLVKEEPKRRKNVAEIDAARSVSKTKTATPKDQGSPKGVILESEVLKWTDEEFAQNLPTLQKAKAEGKFILDVSPGVIRNHA